MKKSTASLNFRQMGGIKLEDFAEGVKAGIFGNLLIFLLAPMTALILQGLITDFSVARLAYESGGKAQKPLYQKTMKALKEALNVFAPYVDTIALGDIAIINLAGFKATNDPSGSKPGTPNVQSLILVVENNAIEQLTSDCEKFPTGSIIIGILSEEVPVSSSIKVDNLGAITFPPGLTHKIIVHTSKQKKKLYQNLTSGLYYYCTYFVIVKGVVSPMSAQVKKMCS